MILTVWPDAWSLRASHCDPGQLSIPISAAGVFAKWTSNRSRRNLVCNTGLPVLSRPTTWKLFFPISMPYTMTPSMRFFMAVSFRELLDYSVLSLGSERTIPLLLSPERRRCAVSHACTQHGTSERRACRLVNQPRGTQHYKSAQREDEDTLTQAIIELASHYGRYGYRRITALLQRAGWQVGKDRVERIWRREGLKVPQRQRPRGRLWLNDGSCVRLRPQRACHVWSYDFVSAQTHDGRTFRILNLNDEHTRECLLIRPERRWSSARVIGALADVMVSKGVPEHIRSDNVLTQERKAGEKRRSLSIPYGMCLT